MKGDGEGRQGGEGEEEEGLKEGGENGLKLEVLQVKQEKNQPEEQT